MEIKKNALGFLWPNDQPKSIHRARVIGLSKSAIQFSTPVPEGYQASVEAFNVILNKDEFLKDWTFEQLDENQTVQVYHPDENPGEAIGRDFIVEVELLTHDGQTIRAGRRINNVGFDNLRQNGEQKMLEFAVSCCVTAFSTPADFNSGTVTYTYVKNTETHQIVF